MNKLIKTILTIIVVVIVVVLFAVFYKPSEKEAVRIGMIITLTGNYQDIGNQMKNGAILAQEEINKQFGNKKLEITFEDGQMDAKTALSAYQKMASADGINAFLIAHSNIARAISEVAQEDKNIVMNINAVASGIPEIGDYIFRNDIRAEDEAKILVDFIKAKGYKKLAFFGVNSDSTTVTNNFVKTLLGDDVQIVFNENYKATETDFRTQIAKIKVANPDAIFCMSAPKQMGEIIKTAVELDLKVPFVSAFHCEGNELLQIAGNLADGLVYDHAIDLNSSDSIIKNYVDRFVEEFNMQPDYKSALAYDSIKILYQAISKCSNDDVDCMRDNLLKIKDYNGITGITTIGENGDTRKALFLKTVKNGQFVPYEE